MGISIDDDIEQVVRFHRPLQANMGISISFGVCYMCIPNNENRLAPLASQFRLFNTSTLKQLPGNWCT